VDIKNRGRRWKVEKVLKSQQEGAHPLSWAMQKRQWFTWRKGKKVGGGEKVCRERIFSGGADLVNLAVKEVGGMKRGKGKDRCDLGNQEKNKEEGREENKRSYACLSLFEPNLLQGGRRRLRAQEQDSVRNRVKTLDALMVESLLM